MPDVDAATRVTGVRVAFDGTLWVHFISRSTAPMRGSEPGTDWWASDEVPQDHLARYDGEVWTTYSATDGLPRLTHSLRPEPEWDVHPDGSVWVFADPEQTTVSDPYSLLWTLMSFGGDTWTEWPDGVELLDVGTDKVELLDIGPDGTVWMGKPGPDHEERLHLASFDGTTWRQYPRLLFTGGDPDWDSLEVAPDGSVWVKADDDHGLYVIIPEVVAE